MYAAWHVSARSFQAGNRALGRAHARRALGRLEAAEAARAAPGSYLEMVRATLSLAASEKTTDRFPFHLFYKIKMR
jgi:hypothetical protein